MRGIRIGKVLGIDVAVDPSWLLVVVLMTWNLTSAFGSWHADWHPLSCIGLALLATLLFFASVLAHEFAHSLVAGTFGMTVRSITLFLFGGVSNLEREPPSPRAELWMAVAGPLLSIGIGVAVTTTLSLVTGPVPSDPQAATQAFARFGPLQTVFAWLGPVNVVIGVFNLIPGFPLDGGRVLRAALWRMTGSLHDATRWAAWVGRTIGWCFILAGIATVFGARVPLVGGGALGGLWLAFIGWFLASAAQQSYGQLLVRDALEGVPVHRVMRREGRVFPPYASVAELANEGFLRGHEHAVPILDDGRLVGIVSVGDLQRAPRDGWDRTLVWQIMTPADSLTVLSPHDDLASAAQQMAQIDVEQLPVLYQGRLVGVLDRRDVARWIEIHLAPAGLRARHA